MPSTLLRIFFLWAILGLPNLRAADTLFIQNDKPYYPLYGHIEVWSDEEGTITVDKASHPSNGKHYQKPEFASKTAKVYWVRFLVFNYASSFDEYRVSVAFTDEVKLYFPTSNGFLIPQSSGDLYTLGQRAVENGQIVFMHFQAPHREARLVYMRLESQTGISQQFKPEALKSLQIYPESGYRERFEKPRFYQAFFYGAIAIMAFYNLFIFFSLRSLDYFYYVVYLICLMLFFTSNNGYLMELMLPNQPRLDLYIRFLSTPALLFFFILFGQGYLYTRKQSPKSHLTFNIIRGILLAVGIGMALGQWKLGRLVSIVMAVGSFVFILIVAIKEWRRGYTPARYFILANLLLIIGGVVFALPRAFGAVMNPITQYSVQFAVVLQAALLSNGLADRIALARRQLAEQELENERLERLQEMERQRLIEEKNRELEVKVEERTKEVVLQKEELEEKNKDITASIRYAERIQRAILGGTSRIEQAFPDAFVLFKPRDIVSGDFYWYNEVNGLKIVIAADCTGHGVPGAFMTVMGNSLLQEIVNDLHVANPVHILQMLDKKIQAMLNVREGEYQPNDGMDAAVLVIDSANGKALFAGAKNPCCYVKNGEMRYVKGSKFPIGSSQFKEKKVFDMEEIALEAGMRFYIYSDGFQDQFEGGSGSKFLSKRFRELLLNNCQLPMKEQKRLLEEAFAAWVGQGKQTDDVLVIGLQVG